MNSIFDEEDKILNRQIRAKDRAAIVVQIVVLIAIIIAGLVLTHYELVGKYL